MTATQNDPQRGRRLADRRKELGLSQREMAVKIGVNRNTIIAWESGTLPQERHIPKTIEGYELDEDFFFSSLGEFERRLQAEVDGIRADLNRLLEHFGAATAGSAADRLEEAAREIAGGDTPQVTQQPGSAETASEDGETGTRKPASPRSRK